MHWYEVDYGVLWWREAAQFRKEIGAPSVCRRRHSYGRDHMYTIYIPIVVTWLTMNGARMRKLYAKYYLLSLITLLQKGPYAHNICSYGIRESEKISNDLLTWRVTWNVTIINRCSPMTLSYMWEQTALKSVNPLTYYRGYGRTDRQTSVGPLGLSKNG